MVGAFISWLSFGGSSNAFDVPVQFLYDYQTTAGDDVSVGLLIVVVAVLVGVLDVVPAFGGRVLLVRVLGLLLIALSAAFFIQLFIAANDLDISVRDIYELGPFLTAAGGLVVLVDR